MFSRNLHNARIARRCVPRETVYIYSSEDTAGLESSINYVRIVHASPPPPFLQVIRNRHV